MPELTSHEIQVLRECDGQLPPSPWGAWIGSCYEALTGLGYLTRLGGITPKGRAWLDANPLPAKETP